MAMTYPPEIEDFIRQEIASGDYSSEAEIVHEALKVLRELKTRHEELRADIQKSLDAAQRGEVSPFNPEDFKKEARRRLAGQE